MTSVNPSAARLYARGFAIRGVAITVQRLTGFAPNVTITSASVNAIVEKVAPDTTEEARTGLPSSATGAITQDDRQVQVSATDLANGGFPLPVIKGDKVVLPTGDMFTVTDVDANTKAMAGVILLSITGDA